MQFWGLCRGTNLTKQVCFTSVFFLVLPLSELIKPLWEISGLLEDAHGCLKKKKQKKKPLKFLMLRRLGDYSSEDKWRQNMYAYIHQKTCTSLIPGTQTAIVSNCKELKGLLPVEWVEKPPSHWTTHKMKMNPLLYTQQHGWTTHPQISEWKKPETSHYDSIHIKFKPGKSNPRC